MQSRVAAIILAAGESSRFGAPKQLAVLGSRTLLGRTLDVVRKSDAEVIILVLGHGADEILKKIDAEGVRVVINKNYRRGLSSSLRAGLAAVDPDVDGVLVVLADQPFLGVSMVNRIIGAHRRSGRRIVVPVHHDVQGNPVLFHRSLFGELAKLSGDAGAKRVIHRHPDDVLRVEVGDPRYLADIDTRQDLKRVGALRQTPGGRTRRSRAAGAPRPVRPL